MRAKNVGKIQPSYKKQFASSCGWPSARLVFLVSHYLWNKSLKKFTLDFRALWVPFSRCSLACWIFLFEFDWWTYLFLTTRVSSIIKFLKSSAQNLTKHLAPWVPDRLFWAFVSWPDTINNGWRRCGARSLCWAPFGELLCSRMVFVHLLKIVF